MADNDSRAKDLTKRVINSLASITGVRLWSDKEGEADALGVEMPEMLSSTAVAEGSSIDYLSLTPKGFAASVATEDRKGIVEKAADAEIASETADKFMDAQDQPKMREHWGKAINTSNSVGRPKFWFKDGVGEGNTVSKVYKLPVMFSATRASGTAYNYYPIPDECRPDGYVLSLVRVIGIWKTVLGAGAIDETLVVSSGTKEIKMPSYANTFKLVFPSSESAPYLYSAQSGDQNLSCDIYLIYQPV